MKKERLHLRVSEEEKEKIIDHAKNLGYDNITQYLIDSSLNKIKDRGIKKKGAMTHTLSLSPTIDYRIDLGESEITKSNKFYSTQKNFIPGGKGINVSLMLDKFNHKNTTIHYSSGFTGEFIWEELNRIGIEQIRIKSQTATRVNIKLSNDNGDLYLFNELVEPINEHGREEIFNYVTNEVGKGDNFVLAGSFNNDDCNFINQILSEAKSKKANIIVDITIDDLGKAIKGINPDLLVITKIVEDSYNKQKVYSILDNYLKLGCKNVAFIEDINFIFFANENDKFIIETPEDANQSMIGLSDALAASFIVHKDLEMGDQLTWMGAAVKAKSSKMGYFTFEEILDYKKSITVKVNK